MRATFLSLEIAKNGLQAAQTGLDITGQNMAKMNAEGYSRQTVQQSAFFYPSSTYKYALLNSQKIGQGVTVDQIVQIRDQFLDARFRTANSTSSDLAKKTEILGSINNILDETLSDGLGVMLHEFYERLETLSLNAGSVEYSGLVRSSAQKIIETLKYNYNQLNTIKNEEQQNLELTVADINSYLAKIKDLNESIQYETLQKNITNDLLDTRNLYLDKLSEQLNITVQEQKDGTVSVKCGSMLLVDSSTNTIANLSIDDTAGDIKIVTDDGTLDITSGEIKGVLDLVNGKGSFAGPDDNDFNGIPFYLDSLDKFASKFAEIFNGLNGDDKPLFVGDTALTLGISDGWIADANYITATTDSDPSKGKNDNILRMINALDTNQQITDKFDGTFSEFVLSLMSTAAVDENYYSDLLSTAESVTESIDNQRESIKGVNLNEETVNLIKYQKAFEASSRVITALDEMLDTIINRMGTVGL